MREKPKLLRIPTWIIRKLNTIKGHVNKFLSADGMAVPQPVFLVMTQRNPYQSYTAEVDLQFRVRIEKVERLLRAVDHLTVREGAIRVEGVKAHHQRRMNGTSAR